MSNEDKTIKSAAQLAFKPCLVPQNTEEGVAMAKGLSQFQFCAVQSLNNNSANAGCASSLNPVNGIQEAGV